MDQIRTHTDIIQDLLTFIERREWEEAYIPCGKGCCGEWVTKCPCCGVKEELDSEYRVCSEHKPDCHLAQMIREAQAFLNAEESLDHG